MLISVFSSLASSSGVEVTDEDDMLVAGFSKHQRENNTGGDNNKHHRLVFFKDTVGQAAGLVAERLNTCLLV